VFFGIAGRPRDLMVNGKSLSDYQFDAATRTVTFDVSATAATAPH
jgi:hypothetical protein